MNKIEELVLVLRAKQGNTTAFEKLYLTYLPAIYRFMYFRVGRIHEDAEDLTQKALIAAWEALSRYQVRKASFRVWVFAIAHNQLIDHWRKEGKRKTIPVSVQIPDDTTKAFDEQLIAKDKIKNLEKAIDTLSQEQKEVIILRHMEDLSFKEIAKIMNKREDAVRALLYRATKELKKTATNI